MACGFSWAPFLWFSVFVVFCFNSEQLDVGEEAGMQCSHIEHIHRSIDSRAEFGIKRKSAV